MRSYVRRWITEWDLDRLYGERKHDLIEEESGSSNYSEDSDFESDVQLEELPSMGIPADGAAGQQ